MWALLQNNPTMVAIIGAVVLIAIALHIGIFIVIRRVMRRDESGD